MPAADVAPVAVEQDRLGLKSDQNLLLIEFLAHPSCVAHRFAIYMPPVL